MENPVLYPFVEKEKEVIDEARQEEINTSSFYNYLSFCMNNYGAENSGDWAYAESQDERRHFKKLSDYYQLRGYEPEMPAIEEPKIPFTDMRSGYMEAMKRECELAEMYEEWIDELKKLPGVNMTLQLFLEMLDIQKWSIDGLRKICLQIEALEEKDDQLEWDKAYFAPKAESPIA